jgi:hypothetical protein
MTTTTMKSSGSKTSYELPCESGPNLRTLPGDQVSSFNSTRILTPAHDCMSGPCSSGGAQEQINMSNIVESVLEKSKREDYFRLIGKRLLYGKN